MFPSKYAPAVALCAFVTLVGWAAPHTQAKPMGLADLLAHVEKTSPEVKAAAAGVRAVAAKRAVVNKLPEPQLTVAAQPLPVETRVGPQRLRVGITQSIPWLPRLTRQAEAVDAGATAARRAQDAVLARVRRDVRVPWADLAWLTRVAGIVKEQSDLLVGLEPSVLARLRTGKAAFEDVQRLRLMIGELNERHLSLLDRTQAAAAQVRAAAGVTPTQALGVAGYETDPLAGRAIPALTELLSGLRSNPDLVAAESRIAAAQAGIAAAQQRRMPDFAVGLDWIMVGEARMPGVTDSGTDSLMVMASVKIPAWTSAYDAEVAASRAQAEQARAGKEVILRKAESRLAQLLFDLRDARRKHQLYAGDLVPRARSALSTAMTSYATGKAMFNDLIELENKLLRYQIRLATAEAARVRAGANLELLLGRSLSASSARKETK